VFPPQAVFLQSQLDGSLLHVKLGIVDLHLKVVIVRVADLHLPQSVFRSLEGSGLTSSGCTSRVYEANLLAHGCFRLRSP